MRVIRECIAHDYAPNLIQSVCFCALRLGPVWSAPSRPNSTPSPHERIDSAATVQGSKGSSSRGAKDVIYSVFSM